MQTRNASVSLFNKQLLPLCHMPNTVWGNNVMPVRPGPCLQGILKPKDKSYKGNIHLWLKSATGVPSSTEKRMINSVVGIEATLQRK